MLSPALRTRFEKAAADTGFDLPGVGDAEWLGFRSSHAPLRVWLAAIGDNVFLAALSQPNVWKAMEGFGTPFLSPLPPGAHAARGVTDLGALHRLLRRAFQLSRSLPDELLQVFAARTAALPRTTEAERLVIQRVGQDVFREGLMDYWDGRCAITGLAVPRLLRASHIKAWSACDSDAERLDVYNGLLLAPNFDAAFDQFLITMEDDGLVVVSDELDEGARGLLGLVGKMRVRSLADGHRTYLGWHRAAFLREGGA